MGSHWSFLCCQGRKLNEGKWCFCWRETANIGLKHFWTYTEHTYRYYGMTTNKLVIKFLSFIMSSVIKEKSTKHITLKMISGLKNDGKTFQGYFPQFYISFYTKTRRSWIPMLNFTFLFTRKLGDLGYQWSICLLKVCFGPKKVCFGPGSM